MCPTLTCDKKDLSKHNNNDVIMIPTCYVIPQLVLQTSLIMVKGKRSSAAKEASKDSSIKNFFGTGAKKAAVKEDGDSPGKTSDYESEASRSVTPALSSGGSSPKEMEEKVMNIVTENGGGGDGEKDVKPVAGAKREVKTEDKDDLEEEGADVFSQPVEKDGDDEDVAEDEVKVKAVLETGLLGQGIAEEERRMAAENRR
jgi:hypothetical protein